MALHSVHGPDAPGTDEGADIDAEAGFFKMSPASAEQVTIQIRSMMERAWEYIAIAYQGRAHIALGYATWDEYVDDRLSDLRLTVPREQGGVVVQSLSRAWMSLRAIARVLGVDPATVHRALGAGDAIDRDDPEEPASIHGRDGKSYPRRRRQQVATTCSICGESTTSLRTSARGNCSPRASGPAPVESRANQLRRNIIPAPRVGRILTRIPCRPRSRRRKSHHSSRFSRPILLRRSPTR
jgi:hypothetical protein